MDLFRQQLSADVKEISEKCLREITEKLEVIFGQDFNEKLRSQARQHLESFYAEILCETNAKIEKVEKLISEEKSIEQKLDGKLNIPATNYCSETISLHKKLMAVRKRVQEKSTMLAKRNAAAILQLRKDVNLLMKVLEIEKSDETETLLKENIDGSEENVEKLRNLKAQCETMLERLESQISEKKLKLKSLWIYSAISQNEQNEFLNLPNSQSTLRLLTTETNRCKEEKAGKLESLIEEIVQEIALFKDKCLIEENPTIQIVEEKNENVLNDLERELSKLKEYYEKHTEIIECIKERDSLLQSVKEENDQSLSDPMAKYKNRGGGLLKKLKEQKIVQKKLHAVEEKLTEALANYEEENGEKFLVYGQPVEIKPTTHHNDLTKVPKNLKFKPFDDVTNVRV